MASETLLRQQAETDRNLTEIEAAGFLGIKPQTLSVWRSTKRYALPYLKIGRCVRYRLADLIAFQESRLVTPATV
jgi:hypothetical protein